MNVGLIGCGRLGLSFALLCDKVGYKVHCFDVNKQRMSSIMDRTLKTSEPEIEDLLQNHNLINCSSVSEVVDSCDLSFVLVATPSQKNNKYDHTQIHSSLRELENKDLTGKNIVISCTTMPKFCISLQEKFPSANIIYNPEFIQQGNIIEGLRKADMVLIGTNKEVPAELLALYEDIQTVSPKFNILSLTGAEIAKIGINCFLSFKVAYANLMGQTVINSGEESNLDAILEAIGSDSRIGNKYFKFGFPVGGLCIPRDCRALKTYQNSVGVNTHFVDSVIEENNNHMDYLESYYEDRNPDKSVPFLFHQITYKPGVDILTESYQYEMAKRFFLSGRKVNFVTGDKSLLRGVQNIITGTENNGYKIN